MLIILGTMILGIAAGYILRHRKLKQLDSIMTVIIWLLLFLLGVGAGSDERIVRWIASLGLEALVISTGAVLGSSVFAFVLWKYSENKTAEKGADDER